MAGSAEQRRGHLWRRQHGQLRRRHRRRTSSTQPAMVGCFHAAPSGDAGFPTCLLADKPLKKKLAVCFHKPPGNYHLIEERLPYGAALFRGSMMGLFVFTMMV